MKWNKLEIIGMLFILGALCAYGWVVTTSLQKNEKVVHQDEHSFIPQKTQAEGELSAIIEPGTAHEATLITPTGPAIAFFGEEAFPTTTQEQQRIQMIASENPAFFVEVRNELNLSDGARVVSPIIEILTTDSTTENALRVRMTLPLNEEINQETHRIFAAYKHVLQSGGVRTDSVARISIDYSVKEVVTFWAEGLPKTAVVIAEPR